MRITTVPDPVIERARPTALVRDHLLRHLRIRPPPLRGARGRSSTQVTCSATSRWAWSRRLVPEVERTSPSRRPRRDPIQHLLRRVLDVRPRPPVPVRDDPESATRAPEPPCSATQSCTARSPVARPNTCASRAGPVRPHQGAGRTARRSLRLPVRRAADRVAGRRVRRGPGRRHARSCSGSARSARWRRESRSTAAAACIAVDLVPDRLERARSHERRGLRPARARGRPRRSRAGDDRRPRPRLRHRRGRDGGARRAGGQARCSRRPGSLPDALATQADGDGEHRPARTRSTSRSSCVRRGGTISISGVYGGMADPLPLRVLFDKQVQIRMGQANVLHWVPEILPLLARRRPAAHRLVREPPRAAVRGSRRLRAVPEEGERLVQGRPTALRRQ